MKIQKIHAQDTRHGIRKVKKLLGDDAVILANRKTPQGIELVVAVDFDSDNIEQQLEYAESSNPKAAEPQQEIVPVAATFHNASDTQLSSPVFPRISADEAQLANRRAATTAPTQPAVSPSSSPPRAQAPQPPAAAYDYDYEEYKKLKEQERLRQLANRKRAQARALLKEQQKREAEALAAKKAAIKAARLKAQQQAREKARKEAQRKELFNMINKKTKVNSAEVIKLQQPMMQTVKSEIDQLRDLMQSQMDYLGWGKWAESCPRQAKLLRQLTAIGLGSDFCRDVIANVRPNLDNDKAWRQALGIWARKTPTKDDDIIKRGGIVSLLGPTGVGKTTTAAKLAARFAARHGKNSVVLISSDNDRLGAHEQLMSLGRSLGISVMPAANNEELRDILLSVQHKKLVIIDTAGMGPNDKRFFNQVKLMNSRRLRIRNYLVMSANTQMSSLDDTVKAYSSIRLSGCIITKIDETASLGSVLTIISKYQLPVTYTTNGQNIEDIERAKVHRLISKAVAFARRHDNQPDETSMAMRYGSIMMSATA